MKPLRRTHCALAGRASVSRDRVESDWMHDTARCLGYPSDSSWTARKRLGSQLSGASPLSFSRSPFLCSFADAHRRHLPHRFGRLVRPAVQHSSLPPGGLPRRPLGSRGRCPGPITLLRLLGRSAVCTGSPVAGDCGGFGITGPYAVKLGVTGPVSRAYHSAASAGPECCVHRIASSGRLRRLRDYWTVRSQDTLLRVPGPLGSPGFQVGRPPGPPAVSGTSRPVSRTRAPVAGPRPCSPWQVWCRRGRKPGCSCSTRTAWARTGPGGRTRTGIARRARTTGRLALAATSFPGLARVWR